MKHPLPTLPDLYRLLALADAGGLSPKGRKRVEWLLHHIEGSRSVSGTCRHFSIARVTFYRLLRRFTHTINASQGCAFAHSTCGVYCYAQHSPWIVKGRAWALYGFKSNIRDAYRRDHDRIRRRRDPLRVYMSPSCDPYQPQEASLEITRALLEEMQTRTPDVLVVQTRSPLVLRDIDLISALAARCELWLSVTVETDLDRVPGLPPHATPIHKRIEALQTFRKAGVPTQGAVSPLLPLADPEAFARLLDGVCDRVVIDHYLIGDGSRGGLRTRRTQFPALLDAAGLGVWSTLAKFEEVKSVFERVLGVDRVRISTAGFNAVGEG